MKVLFTLSVIPLLCCTALKIDYDDPEAPLDNLNEAQFEEIFKVAPSNDAAEEAARAAALKQNEAEVHKINKEYEAGKVHFFEDINEFSNLPDGEFLDQKTGAMVGEDGFYRGFIDATDEADRYDEESERYFDQFRYSRATTPDSYNALELGYVTPAKDQRDCGSCTAFATMAAIETCFAKVTGGVQGDYSEQQLVDCGYSWPGAYGCGGAYIQSYVYWAANTSLELAHESQYPYVASNSTYDCPADLPRYNQGARISGAYYTHQGTEELLKELVYEHGAVVTVVDAGRPFSNYGGGILDTCTSQKQNHAVTVVGYGEENGIPYWVVKNSWNERWGDKGFIRLKRGDRQCGIAQKLSVVKCEAVPGPTDGPLTTETPCVDYWANCATQLADYCYAEHIAVGCRKSCGLCPGMTPHYSNTCFNKYGYHCSRYCNTQWAHNCTKACDPACKRP